jgi:hypothetical protein
MLSLVNGKLLPFHEKRNGGSSMWRKNCIFVVRCPLKVSCIRHPLCRVKGLILLLISTARRSTEGSQLLPRAAPCRSPWRSCLSMAARGGQGALLLHLLRWTAPCPRLHGGIARRRRQPRAIGFALRDETEVPGAVTEAP